MIHVYQEGGEWCVWLNTEASNFDGLCIGIGATRDLAVTQAVQALEAIVDFLQEPPPDLNEAMRGLGLGVAQRRRRRGTRRAFRVRFATV